MLPSDREGFRRGLWPWVSVCAFPAVLVFLLAPLSPVLASERPEASVSVNDIVSGTNSKATGRFAAASGAFVTFMKLWVSGTLVKTYTYGTDDWLGESTRLLGVTFASTHFADGAGVQVRVWGRDNLGNVREDTETTSVYNKAYVLGNWTMSWEENAVAEVSGRCGAMNHSVTQSMAHEKPTILNNLPTYTVFYAYTHGDIGVFADCVGDENAGPEHRISADEVLSGDNGKSPQQPPYNLVYVDACLSGGTDALARGFEVVDPNSGAPIADIALIGWFTVVGDLDTNMLWLSRLWGALVGAQTVWEAVGTANAGGLPDAHLPEDHQAQATVYGNHHTKLVGVYMGNPGQWYK